MAGVKGRSGKKLDTLITDALRLAMLRAAEDPAHKNRVHAMAEEIAKRAETGDMVAVQFVTDRIEGKATQPVDHSGEIEISEQVKFDAESFKGRITSLAAGTDAAEVSGKPH